MCGIKLNVFPKVNVEENVQKGPDTVVVLSGHYRNKTVLQTAKV